MVGGAGCHYITAPCRASVHQSGSHRPALHLTMFVAVDAQGFTGRKGEFVIKEIAFCDKDQHDVVKFYLKPPYSFMSLSQCRQRAAAYVRQRVHGLNWSDGVIPYDQGLKMARNCIDSSKLYYCKGEEKARALTELLRIKVYNIEHFMDQADEQSYYVYQDGHAKCSMHDRDGSDHYLKCAVKQAYCVSTVLCEFFEPLSYRYSVSILDMYHVDCRLDSFRFIRSALSASPVVAYLARIGYYLKGDSIFCHFCSVECKDWQEGGSVQPQQIVHFHSKCPNMT